MPPGVRSCLLPARPFFDCWAWPSLLLQVAQEQLVRARRQLLAAREAHADRAASYRSQLAAEAVLHQALSAVAGQEHPLGLGSALSHLKVYVADCQEQT